MNSIEGVPVSDFAKELSAKWAKGDIESKDKTDSLISIKENVKDIIIPSEERKIKMYPMDFEEFCWALNENAMVEYIKKCWVNMFYYLKTNLDFAFTIY